jgi:hypothetical protein
LGDLLLMSPSVGVSSDRNNYTQRSEGAQLWDLGITHRSDIGNCLIFIQLNL